MTLRYTFTRTYEAVDFADPFLVCGRCGRPVTGWLPGAGRTGLLLPCEHDAGIVSTCPSWGPVDGCQCRKFLGYVPHPAQAPQEQT